MSFSLDSKSSHGFGIYLRNKDNLHMTWWVKDGSKISYQLITPAGKHYGFCEKGKYAGGTLQDGPSAGLSTGQTIFSPSQYEWGEGYFEFFATSLATTGKTQVEVHYWIETLKDKPPTS
jgi:hypothetical protein